MRSLQPLSNRLGGLPGSSLAHIKTQSVARDEEEKIRRNRIKGAIVIVEQFLADQGYSQTLQMLQQESQVSFNEYCAADNIDLVSVIHEYEQFYQFKFQKKPKLFRLRGGGEEDVKVINEGGEKMLIRKTKGVGGAATSHQSPSYGSVSQNSTAGNSTAGDTTSPHGSSKAVPGRSAPPPLPSKSQKVSLSRSDDLQLNVEGTKVTTTQENYPDGDAEDSTEFYSRALKPLPVFHNSELSELAGTIMRDILDVNPSVRWNDIAELHQAKQLLQEAVVMPIKYPELFEGIVRPWKGILLFGPPGTGKTMLAKAVATECRTTFFNISASTVVSKWRGDSEKLVRMLFDLAVHYAPSTIFIDEIDSLMSARSSEGEHEGSRRMKTELLTQMDGLSKRKGGEIVFVLAASNVPWDLDTAMLRRLEKRVLVTLPTFNSRKEMFQRLLHNYVDFPDTFNWDRCAELTDMMSGADVDTLCREAMMRPIRKAIKELESKNISMDDLRRRECSKPKVTVEDVEASVACTRSSVGIADLKKYDKWMQEFGSGLST